MRSSREVKRLLAAGGPERQGTVQLAPPPEFLREALAEGSILAFFKKHGRFPGERARD